MLEKYDGITPLTIFVGQMESCTRYNGWDEEYQAMHLRVGLKGNTAYIIDDESFEDATYEQMVTHLKNRYGTEGQSSLYRSQMRTRRRTFCN